VAPGQLGQSAFRPQCGPTLATLIGNERQHRRTLPPVEERASNLLRTYVAMGTIQVRSHVDIDSEAGLASIEGVFAARERHHDLARTAASKPEPGRARSYWSQPEELALAWAAGRACTSRSAISP